MLQSKSSLVYASALAFYLACALTLNPRVAHLFNAGAGFAGNTVIALFMLHLNIFWLFGSYYFMLRPCTLLDRFRRPRRPEPERDGPPDALLYVTMNDFQSDRRFRVCARITPLVTCSSSMLIVLFIVDREGVRLIKGAGRRPHGATVCRHPIRPSGQAWARLAYAQSTPRFEVIDAFVEASPRPM